MKNPAAKTLIVFAHPQENSFNHAILNRVMKGLEENNHEVRVKDLYVSGFDGVLTNKDLGLIYSGKTPTDIKAEQADVAWANHLVFIYPFWWWDRPAILKGWIDRTWVHGFAYQPDGFTTKGLLKHKTMVIVTAGVAEEIFRKDGVLDILHKPMTEGTLKFCGIEDVTLKAYYDVGGDSEEKRKAILDDVENAITAW